MILNIYSNATYIKSDVLVDNITINTINLEQLDNVSYLSDKQFEIALHAHVNHD